MKKYKLAQTCQQELARLDAIEDKSKIDHLKQQEALAVAEAVEGIAKLNHKDVLKKLEEFAAGQTSRYTTLVFSHGEQFLRSKDPLFWCMCFVRLFPRGDCAERCDERRSSLPSWRWAKCLLTRADNNLWRLDVEFVASLYNIFLRRDQMQAVEAFCHSLELSEGVQSFYSILSSTNMLSIQLKEGVYIVFILSEQQKVLQRSSAAAS